jgi:hypothetical protein
MKNLDLILNSFKIQTKCPICKEKVIRKFQTSFRGAQSSSVFASFPNKSDYDTMIFTKELASNMDAMAVPSICDLLQQSPPSIHFMEIDHTYVICPKTHYYLWFDGNTFVPSSERFIIQNLDIIIKSAEIQELGTQLRMPTSRNYILACTPEEIINKVQKVIMLQ